jgi:deoxyribonuclease II
MGHTKGVVVFDKADGFWLVHSVPKFPPHPATDPFGYPSTGEKFGQSFLCISVSTPQTADLIGLQFLYNHPFVYSVNFPDWAAGNYPQLEMAGNEKHVKKPPFFHTVQFRCRIHISFVVREY